MNFRVCDVLVFVPESEKVLCGCKLVVMYIFFFLILRVVGSICLSVGPLIMKFYCSSHAYQVFVLCE